MKTLLKLSLLLGLVINYYTVAAQKQLARKDLMNVVINQQVSVAEIKEVTIPAGQSALKHLHPCPVVGYVLSGTVLFQIEGEESKTLKEGDAFYEPMNTAILHFDNASKDKPLIFVAFYLKEKKEENIKIL